MIVYVLVGPYMKLIYPKGNNIGIEPTLKFILEQELYEKISKKIQLSFALLRGLFKHKKDSLNKIIELL
jgi:hypothetical protein